MSALPSPGSQYCQLYEVRKYVFILLYILNIQGQHGPYRKVAKQCMFIELSYWIGESSFYLGRGGGGGQEENSLAYP